MRILVTGATGYIGGRLVPRLLELGHEVTVLVRDARRYAGRSGSDRVRVIERDLLRDDLGDELRGFDAAYYLVHSMLGGKGFYDRDHEAARRFAEAVGGCGHVIYVGGLVPDGEVSSVHLRSRADTGAVLEENLAGRVTEFRAGPIIGSGSASFEMVRYLTERLPVMVTPRWVRNAVQPIGIRDVLCYLVEALEVGPVGVVEIGGERMTFAEMMHGYARCRGLPRRWILPTPVLAPSVAARWVGFVTPVPNRLAVPLVRGLVQPLLADTRRAEELFGDVVPLPYGDAVRSALARTEKNAVETRWSDALGGSRHRELEHEEGLIREVRRVRVDAPVASVYRAFSAMGGKRGWGSWNWAWVLRGWLDKLVGGPGLRRGRRDPDVLLEGDAVDFWRVERAEQDRLLRLRAEMKVPGRAWLQWEAERSEDGAGAVLTQMAVFEPKGLLGVAYWYALYPLHGMIFGSMAEGIGKRAVRHEKNTDSR